MSNPEPSTRARIEDLAEHLMEYLDARWDLLVLNLTERGVSVLTGLITGLFLTIFGGTAIVFASVGAALWLGDLLHSRAGGFFAMAGILLLLLVFAIIFARNWLRDRITNSLLDAIKENQENEEETPRF